MKRTKHDWQPGAVDYENNHISYPECSRCKKVKKVVKKFASKGEFTFFWDMERSDWKLHNPSKDCVPACEGRK
jgi:hypothetical protein